MNLHGGHSELRPPAGSEPAAQVENTPSFSGGHLGMSVLAFACAASVIAAGWWALGATLQTLPSSSLPVPFGGEPGAPDASSSISSAPVDPGPPVPLDLAAFRVPLWVAPHRPPATTDSASTAAAQAKAVADSAPPLRWQLLAIIGDRDAAKAGGGGPARAMIYDPDDDRVYDLGIGAQRAGAAIESIAAGRVTVTRGDNSYTLSLDGPVVLQRGGR